MIKQALEYIVGLGEAKEFEFDGRKFTDKRIYPLDVPQIDGFKTSTLSSVVDYIVKNPDLHEDLELIINIESPTRVYLKTRNLKPYMYRETLLSVEANLPKLSFSNYLDVESFIIEMQSKFIMTDNVNLLVGLASNVEEEQIKRTTDDGMAQVITAKTGIARVSDVIVPNPVELKPFRTFVEVDQPESLFVFRMKTGPSMALFEADGGAWRNQAIINIKSYFDESEALKELIESGKLVILA